MSSKENISKALARAGILSFGDYILASGIHTRYYVNFSLLANTPHYLKAILDEFTQFLRKNELLSDANKIIGVLNKGLLFVPPISLEFKKSFVLFEKNSIDLAVGTLDLNDEAVIIDDMISTGKTIEKVYRIATNIFKCKVLRAIVILDREEGGVERLKRIGLNVYSMIKITELADTLGNLGLLSEEEREIIYSEVKERKKRRRIE